MTKREAAEILRDERCRWTRLERLHERHGDAALAKDCRRMMEALEMGAGELEDKP